MTLYKSLVRSHLEYCCPLWNSSTLADIQQLEGVQRTFTSRISGVGHLNYWERLKALNLMSLQRRRERYIIIHMWKLFHGKCPNDLQITFSGPSRQGYKAVVPSLGKSSSLHNQFKRYSTGLSQSWDLDYGTWFLPTCTQSRIPYSLSPYSQRLWIPFRMSLQCKGIPAETVTRSWIGTATEQLSRCPGGLLLRWPDRGIYESMKPTEVTEVSNLQLRNYRPTRALQVQDW